MARSIPAICSGFVAAAKWFSTTGANAPRRSRDMSFVATSSCNSVSENLTATTQDTVCRIYRTTFLDSTQHIQQFGWRNFCDRPSSKSRKDVTLERRTARIRWLSDQIAEYLPNHSRATTSKLFAVLLIRADFSALRFSAGSMPSAINLRDRSLRSRASRKPTSGIHAERETLFFAAKSVFQAPPFSAGRRDFHVEFSLVKKPGRLRTWFEITDSYVCQRHAGGNSSA
jgi:hypothetical protein